MIISLTDPVSYTVATSATGTAGYALWAQNSGSITADTPVLTVNSGVSSAVVAQSGGKISLGDGIAEVMVTSGGSAPIVQAAGTGSMVSFTGANLTLDTTLPLSQGMNIGTGASLSMTDSTFSLISRSAQNTGSFSGVLVSSGSSFSVDNVTLSGSTTAGNLVVSFLNIAGGTLSGDGLTLQFRKFNTSFNGSGMLTVSAGGSANLANINVSDMGTGVSGIQAQTNSAITLTNGTVNIGTGALIANGINALFTANNIATTTTRAGQSTGAANGGTLTLNGGSVTAQAAGSTAIYAISANSRVNITGTSVTFAGAANSVTQAYGLYANGANTLISADTVSLTGGTSLSFSNPVGAYAVSGGEIRITNNSSIVIPGNTSNSNAAGIWATGTNSRISLAASSISTSTRATYGARAEAAATINLTAATIRTTGANSPALYANGSGSAITATSGTTVTASGSASHGILLQNGASVSLTASSVSATGSSASAISASGASNTASLAGSTLTSSQAPAIDVTSGATAITASDSAISGSVLLNTTGSSNVSLTATDASSLSGRIDTASGSTTTLSLAGDSIWTMTAASNLTALTMDAGILRYGASAAFTSTNPIILNSGGGTVDTNGFDNTLAPVVTGDGMLTKTGSGTLTLTAANTYGGGTEVAAGTLQLAPSSTSSLTNLGSGAVDIAAGATLSAVTANAFTFANVLAGSGLLSASNGGNAFSFDPATGSAFAGTVALANDTFALSGVNTASLVNATLRLDGGNLTTVGAGNQTIKGLAFNGGTLIFGIALPADTIPPGTLTTSGDLDIAGTGKVQITVPAGGFDNTQPVPNTELPLLEQDEQAILIKLAGSTGTVTGTGGSLTLVDQNGVAISNGRVVDIAQAGAKVAEGTYDYRLVSSADGTTADGLYVGYGLTQLNLIGAGANALVLAPAAGATGLATDLSARIVGSGDLAIAADTGNTVSLSNGQNSYSGVTEIRTGTLQMGNDNVLGATSALSVATGAAFDMAGYSQSVGALNTQAGATVTIAAGSNLTILDTQRTTGSPDGGAIEDNTLFGAGTLVIDPSIVRVNGSQAGFTGALQINDGSRLILNTVNALDNVQGVELAGTTATLTFADLSSQNAAWTALPEGTAAAALSGSGIVQTRDGADVTLAGDNTRFTGRFDVGTGTFLRASDPSNLGTASVLANGTFNAVVDADWQLDNAVTGNGTVLKTGPAVLTVDRALAGFTGVTDIREGTLVVGDATTSGALVGGAAKVASGATLSGNGMVVGEVTNAGTIAALNALPAFAAVPASNFTIGGVLTNSGTVQLGGAAIGNTLTVNSIVGRGGTFVLNTILGNDDSPTDRIIVNGGSVTGHNLLSIVNAGGLGAQTAGNGIAVVVAQNGATSEAGSFTLTGRVAAGAYEYDLLRGDASGSGDSWYLRTPAHAPTPTPADGLRPEIPVNAAIMPLASELGYAMLATLHERSGSTFVNAGPVYEDRLVWCKDPKTSFRCVARAPVQNDARGERFFAGGWARIFADRGEKSDKNFLQRGSDYLYTLGGVQVGLDMFAREETDGTLDKAGLYVGYGQLSADIKGIDGGKAGSVDLNGTSVGAYWTHYAASGWYTDAVVQGTWYTSDARSVKGEQVKPDGFGLIASLEGGYQFKLGSGWTLEPQAQVIYQTLRFDKTVDHYGTFRFADGDSIRARIGARLARTWNSGTEQNPRLTSVWLRANVWHEFSGKYKTTTATFANMSPFFSATALGGTWGEIGAGVNARVSDNVNLFASAAYQHSLDNRNRQSWNGRLGVNVRW